MANEKKDAGTLKTYLAQLITYIELLFQHTILENGWMPNNNIDTELVVLPFLVIPY